MKKIISSLLVIFTLIFVLAYSTQVFGDNQILRDILYLIAAVFPVLVGIYAVKKLSRKSILGKSLFYITIAYTCFFIGDLIWIIDSYLKFSTTFSIPDLLYLLFYLFTILAILNWFKLSSISWTPKRKYFTIIISVLLSIVTFYLLMYQAYDSSESTFLNILYIGYGFGDLLLIIFAILLINLAITIKRGALYKSWFILVFALISLWLADILYALYNEQYDAGNLIARHIDYLWISFYIFGGFSILAELKSIFVPFLKKSKVKNTLTKKVQKPKIQQTKKKATLKNINNKNSKKSKK